MDGTVNEPDAARNQAITRWRGTESAPPQTNPEIFSTSFRELTPALYDFLQRLSGREETADALIRQVASQAAMSAASATQWPSARAWLFARAYAALPEASAAASADPTPFIETDPTMLPPTAPESGLDDMARAVWRAISAVPIAQHALLHLHTREAMVGGEAASVLGITEREAMERLQRLVPAVEAASRALFLIRYGRPRDPDLDALLAQMNITRLTPEARARIEEYAENSPTAQALLHAVPPPLTVYAALRPLPTPPAVVEEAVAGALPWLAVATQPAGPKPADATTTIPEAAPNGAAYETTALTPEAAARQYGDGAGATEPYGYTYDAPTEAVAAEYGSYGAVPPPGTQPDQWDGTQMLDIPVRQRVVQEEPVYTPPRRTSRGIGPLALLGVLGGALILVVGALVIFLVKGDSGSSGANVTATVASGTATAAGSPTNTISPAISPALLTATALVNTIGTPTPLPTATTAPRPPSAGTTTVTSGSAVATVGSTPTPLGTAPIGTSATDAALATAIATEINTIAVPSPRVTQIPVETPTPRVTPAPTNTSAPTKAATAAATATTAAPTATTAKATAAAATATTTSGGTIAVDKGSVAIGSGSSTAAVTLSNDGSGGTTFTTKASTSWLSVSPASGSIPAGGTIPATVSISRSGLKPGQQYSGSITFTTANGRSTTVTVTVTA